MLLSDMKEKQKGVIIRNNASGEFGGRLRDMGFTVGEEIICRRKALFSSPILFTVKGSSVALRKKDAVKIEVLL